MAKLTAEEQNARMGQERKFLANLLESALKGQGSKVIELTEAYAAEHNLSKANVLSQFKDAQQRTAIHFACQSSPDDATEDDDILRTLLAKKWLSQSSAQAIIRLKDKSGLTPLMLAAQHPIPSIGEWRVRILLQIGGDKLALGRSNTGATALHYAAGAGASPATIHMLADAAKVAVKTASLQGGTPLHWAAAAVDGRQDFSGSLQALLDCGADIEGVNEQGLTALVMAAAAGNDSHSKCLLQAGASPAVVIPGNVTIYHMAADLNLVGTLAELLEKYPESSKEQIEKKNDAGETPLDLACREGHLGCVMLLTGENNSEAAAKFMEEHKGTLGPRMVEPPAPEPQHHEEAVEVAIELEAKQRGLDILSQHISHDDKQRSLELKNMGNQHFAKEEWSQAIERYSQAIDADPSNETFYSNRSASYLKLGKKEDALSDAMICTVLKSDWAKAFYRLAVARMELGRYEDAAVSAWDGLQLDQQNDELKRLLQKCVKQGRKEHFENEKAKGEGENEDER